MGSPGRLGVGEDQSGRDQVTGKGWRKSAGRDSWNWGAFRECCGNLVQWKLPGPQQGFLIMEDTESELTPFVVSRGFQGWGWVTFD